MPNPKEVLEYLADVECNKPVYCAIIGDTNKRQSARKFIARELGCFKAINMTVHTSNLVPDNQIWFSYQGKIVEKLDLDT